MWPRLHFRRFRELSAATAEFVIIVYNLALPFHQRRPPMEMALARPRRLCSCLLRGERQHYASTFFRSPFSPFGPSTPPKTPPLSFYPSRCTFRFATHFFPLPTPLDAFFFFRSSSSQIFNLFTPLQIFNVFRSSLCFRFSVSSSDLHAASDLH